jgi:hypothetical protein
MTKPWVMLGKTKPIREVRFKRKNTWLRRKVETAIKDELRRKHLRVESKRRAEKT